MLAKKLTRTVFRFLDIADVEISGRTLMRKEVKVPFPFVTISEFLPTWAESVRIRYFVWLC